MRENSCQVKLCDKRHRFTVNRGPADDKAFRFASGACSLDSLFERRADDAARGLKVRHKGYLFTSAQQGERNHWPIVCLWRLNSGERRQIRLDATNESMRQICRAVGISTQWYSVEDCWCDLAYLKRVIDATYWVLMKYFGVNQLQRQDLYPRIKELFRETDLYDKLDEITDADGKVMSTRESIEAFFYEMFITFGIFKSLHGLFMDPWEHPYSEKLFSLYVQYFRAEGMLTAEKETALYAQKTASIQEHVDKLKRISPKNSPNYRTRKREIIAEWTAFAALQAAGFDSGSKLFADRERMLSIDDYYHMVRNPNTTLEGDLSEVLWLLDSIYGPLVDSETPDGAEYQFEETAYRAAMLAEGQALQGADIETLFDRFLDITKRSRNHPAIEKVLGRNDICDADTVDSYRREILRCLREQPEDQHVEVPSRKRFFISYCSDDAETVLRLCAQLEERHYHVVLDEQRFEVGSNWKERAKEEISSPDCVGVIVFAGPRIAYSEAVEFELGHARRKGKKILPVNLLPTREIYEYLDNIDHQENADQHYADSMKKHFSKHTVYATPGDFLQKLTPELDRLLEGGDERIGDLVRQGPYSELEVQVINFYALLKYGFGRNDASFEHKPGDRVDEHFSEETEKRTSVTRCVYPLIVSVRETKIKRDNIALIGYEIIKSNTSSTDTNQYILSSRRLDTDDYYCIPNYRLTGTNGLWMVEPFLTKRLDLSPKSEPVNGAEA